jgi:hypothetical protein
VQRRTTFSTKQAASRNLSSTLELELIQTYFILFLMAQKPMLRVEVYARALRTSQNVKRAETPRSMYPKSFAFRRRSRKKKPSCPKHSEIQIRRRSRSLRQQLLLRLRAPPLTKAPVQTPLQAMITTAKAAATLHPAADWPLSSSLPPPSPSPR